MAIFMTITLFREVNKHWKKRKFILQSFVICENSFLKFRNFPPAKFSFLKFIKRSCKGGCSVFHEQKGCYPGYQQNRLIDLTSKIVWLRNECNTQSAFTFSKLTIEILEQGVKYVQS